MLCSIKFFNKMAATDMFVCKVATGKDQCPRLSLQRKA